MAFKKSYDAPQPSTGPACSHLRSKAMYVLGDLDACEAGEQGDGEHYWCLLTQHVRGPDQDYVGRPRCVPGRKCFCHPDGS